MRGWVNTDLVNTILLTVCAVCNGFVLFSQGYVESSSSNSLTPESLAKVRSDITAYRISTGTISQPACMYVCMYACMYVCMYEYTILLMLLSGSAATLQDKIFITHTDRFWVWKVGCMILFFSYMYCLPCNVCMYVQRRWKSFAKRCVSLKARTRSTTSLLARHPQMRMRLGISFPSRAASRFYPMVKVIVRRKWK